MELLTPDGVSVTAGDTTGKDRDGKPMSLYAVRLEANRAAWTNVVAFSWQAVESAPAVVHLEQAGGQWIFRAGQRSFRVPQ
jgi:hypothetical protein